MDSLEVVHVNAAQEFNVRSDVLSSDLRTSLFSKREAMLGPNYGLM